PWQLLLFSRNMGTLSVLVLLPTTNPKNTSHKETIRRKTGRVLRGPLRTWSACVGRFFHFSASFSTTAENATGDSLDHVFLFLLIFCSSQVSQGVQNFWRDTLAKNLTRWATSKRRSVESPL